MARGAGDTPDQVQGWSCLPWATGWRGTSTHCGNLTGQALPRGPAMRGWTEACGGRQDHILGEGMGQSEVRRLWGATTPQAIGPLPAPAPKRPRPPQASVVIAPLVTTRSDVQGLSRQLFRNYSLITTSVCSQLLGHDSEACLTALHNTLMDSERQTQAKAGRAEGLEGGSEMCQGDSGLRGPRISASGRGTA